MAKTNPSNWAAQSQRLLNQFRDLNSTVASLAFSKRDDHHALPDMAAWKGIKKFFYYYAHPMEWYVSGNIFGLIYFIGSMWSWIIWWAFAIIILSKPLGTYLVFNQGSITPNVIEITLLIIPILFLASPFIRMYYLLKDDRYLLPMRRAVVVVAVLSFPALLVVCFFKLPAGVFQIYFSGFGNFIFLVLGVCSLLPFSIYMVITIFDFMEFFGVIACSSLKSINTFYKPVQYDLIQSILKTDFSQSDRYWKLSDLSIKELETFQEWSEANRDTSEKRLNTALLFFAVMSILVANPTMNSFLSKIFSSLVFLFSGFWINRDVILISSATIVWYLVSVLIFVMAVWCVGLLLRMIRNLAVQGLIIESCIVAKQTKSVIKKTKHQE
jgi:hypothetical protein